MTRRKRSTFTPGRTPGRVTSGYLDHMQARSAASIVRRESKLASIVRRVVAWVMGKGGFAS